MASIRIDLEDNQIQALERLAQRQRRSVAEVIREAVDAYVNQNADDASWERRLDELLAGCGRRGSGTPWEMLGNRKDHRKGSFGGANRGFWPLRAGC
jgi:predicted DNA-binding protein